MGHMRVGLLLNTRVGGQQHQLQTTMFQEYSGATSEFVVAADAPSTLYYYCGAHSGMGGASSINVADSTSGIILTYGTHALVANSTVSGEYTIATNYDGTTSNLYVNGCINLTNNPDDRVGCEDDKNWRRL